MADRVVREGEIEFTRPIQRAVLRDPRLSFGARGMFCFVWDLPRNWKPNIAHLAEMGPDGKEAVRSRLKELRAVGAVRIEPLRKEGGMVAGKQWVLADPAKWAIQGSLSPSSSIQTEGRNFRKSVNPNIADSRHKVHQSEGSATKNEAANAKAAPGNAAARSKFDKRFQRRPSGIVTWCESDEIQATRIENDYAQEAVSGAVKSLCSEGRSPVPGSVECLIKKAASAKAGSDLAKLAKDESDARVKKAMASDRKAAAIGAKLLKKRSSGGGHHE